VKYGFIITGGEAREQVEGARSTEATGWDGVFTWDDAGATWWIESDWSNWDVAVMRRRIEAGPQG